MSKWRKGIDSRHKFTLYNEKKQPLWKRIFMHTYEIITFIRGPIIQIRFQYLQRVNLEG